MSISTSIEKGSNSQPTISSGCSSWFDGENNVINWLYWPDLSANTRWTEQREFDCFMNLIQPPSQPAGRRGGLVRNDAMRTFLPMDQFDVRTSGNVQLNMVRRQGDGKGKLGLMGRCQDVPTRDGKFRIIYIYKLYIYNYIYIHNYIYITICIYT